MKNTGGHPSTEQPQRAKTKKKRKKKRIKLGIILGAVAIGAVATGAVDTLAEGKSERNSKIYGDILISVEAINGNMGVKKETINRLLLIRDFANGKADLFEVLDKSKSKENTMPVLYKEAEKTLKQAIAEKFIKAVNDVQGSSLGVSAINFDDDYSSVTVLKDKEQGISETWSSDLTGENILGPTVKQQLQTLNEIQKTIQELEEKETALGGKEEQKYKEALAIMLYESIKGLESEPWTLDDKGNMVEKDRQATTGEFQVDNGDGKKTTYEYVIDDDGRG